MRRRFVRSAAAVGVTLVAVAALAPAAAAAGVIDTSPHNYRGDGSTRDDYDNSSTMDNSLVWTGSPSYVAVSGTYGGDQAFYFNGSSSLSAKNSTLANYGTRDFSYSFSFATSSNTSQDLVSKRAACASGASGTFFDVRAIPGRGIQAELGDAGNADVTATAPLTNFGDGAYHTVFVSRSGTSLSISVDNSGATSTTSATVVNLDNGVPLSLATGPCVGKDGTANLTGALNNLQINVVTPPGTSLPEAPYAAALALSGMGAIGATMIFRRRRTV